jgi:hypothetical protein
VPGVEGDNGNDGTDGLNAFTITTSDFNVPAVVNNTVAITCGNTSWLVVGQTVIVGQGVGGALTFPGPATFQVASITSLNAFVGKWLQYSGDVAGGTLIGSGTGTGGAVVSPSGGLFTSPLPIASGGTGAATVALALKALGLMSTGQFQPFSVYGLGVIASSAYVMTATAFNGAATQVAINGTDVKLAITQAGTYLIQGKARVDYSGATFAAPKLISGKIRNTNTGADISNAASGLIAPIITTATYTHGNLVIPAVIYTTAVATDVLWLLMNVATLPSAGTVEIAEASLLATKLY